MAYCAAIGPCRTKSVVERVMGSRLSQLLWNRKLGSILTDQKYILREMGTSTISQALLIIPVKKRKIVISPVRTLQLCTAYAGSRSPYFLSNLHDWKANVICIVLVDWLSWLTCQDIDTEVSHKYPNALLTRKRFAKKDLLVCLPVFLVFAMSQIKKSRYWKYVILS
jgi:hypothetical protein